MTEGMATSAERTLAISFGIALAIVALGFVPATLAANAVVSSPDRSVIGADIGGGLVAMFFEIVGMFCGGLAAALAVRDWRGPFIAVTILSLCYPFPLLLFTDHYDSGVFVLVLPLLGVGLFSVGLGTGIRRLTIFVYRKLATANA